VPENIWVVTQYFRHTNKERHAELQECVRRNCANPFIDRIVMLNEKDYAKEWSAFPGSTKIRQVIIGKRLTYAHYLQYVHDIVPPNTFTVLSNLDIYLDTESLVDLWKIPMQNRLLALLRYDVTSKSDMVDASDAVLFGPRADSQDTWILHAASVKETEWNYSVFDFPLGQPGCDNAFAGHMLTHRYVITNPALTLKTFHVHTSGIRGYNKADTITSPLYINIVPTHIIDTQQKQVPEVFQCICNELVEFTVQSSSMSNEITYCTMLEKAGRYKWEPSVENHYFDPAIPVYMWNTKGQPLGVTPNGLVYDPYTIYTGKHAEEYPFWNTSTVDIFTIMQTRTQMFAIPFASVELFKNPDTYLLQYISRCLRLKKEFPEYAAASFWIPKEFESYLSQFAHGLEGTPVYFDKHTACCAEKVIGFVPSALEFGREDMVGLRELLPSWSIRPKGRICCIVVSDILTKVFIERVLTPYFAKTWTIRCIDTSDANNFTVNAFENLIGAAMCIFVNRGNPVHWAKLWALPKHCCVLEFQQELAIEGEFQHLAHVCEFNSWVLLLSKGTVEDVQQQVVEQLRKWFTKNELAIV